MDKLQVLADYICLCALSIHLFGWELWELKMSLWLNRKWAIDQRQIISKSAEHRIRSEQKKKCWWNQSAHFHTKSPVPFWNPGTNMLGFQPPSFHPQCFSSTKLLGFRWDCRPLSRVKVFFGRADPRVSHEKKTKLEESYGENGWEGMKKKTPCHHSSWFSVA